MIKFKPGCTIRFGEQINRIVEALQRWCDSQGGVDPVSVEFRNVMITSGLDSSHKTGSLHYVGLALDIRTWDHDFVWMGKIKVYLKERLGPDYDIIFEPTKYKVDASGNVMRDAAGNPIVERGEHIHVEYDPK